MNMEMRRRLRDSASISEAYLDLLSGNAAVRPP